MIGERSTESTPITMDVRHKTRSGAEPIHVRPRLLFVRERAILDVEDAVGEFEERGRAAERLQLADRIEIPGRGAGVVLANAKSLVVDETIRRERQIGWGGAAPR